MKKKIMKKKNVKSLKCCLKEYEEISTYQTTGSHLNGDKCRNCCLVRILFSFNFKVDLLTETRLTKIATKGFILNGKPAFVKTFKLQTSEDGVSFKTYQQNGRDLVREKLVFIEYFSQLVLGIG